MNRRTLLATAAILAVLLAGGGEAFARGGAGRGPGYQARTAGQAAPGTQAGQLRPADSRRRDGTFLTTGTTANGATTRPGNGRGARDGSGCTAAPTTE